MTDQAKQDQPFFHGCKANGCPLPVAKVTKYWPVKRKRDEAKPRGGVCEYHAIVPAHDWMPAVDRIKQHWQGLRVLYAVRSLTGDAYKPFPGETVEHWLTRLDDYLHDQITGHSPAQLAAVDFENLKKQLAG